jgi:hypothetical protein
LSRKHREIRLGRSLALPKAVFFNGLLTFDLQITTQFALYREKNMPVEDKREMLRHFLATLAYRGSNVLQDLPLPVSTFRPNEAVRSPVEILNHVNGVLNYAHSFFVEYESTRPPLSDWNSKVSRYFEFLHRLDKSISSGVPLNEIREEQLLQGPFADAMLHLGQIGIFRRMAGSPVAPENYLFADIQAGKFQTTD